MLLEFCLSAKGEYKLKRVRSSSKKRIWAALKRKVTVGVRECEACQRYSEKKERRPVAVVMPKSIDSSTVLALCCCYKALSQVLVVGSHRGSFCEKLLEAFPKSHRASSSWLQDGCAAGQG